MTTHRFPDPGPPTVTMTDRFGDSIQVAPDGQGHVLFSILPKEEDAPGVHVSIPAVWIPALFTQVVKATGMDPNQLAKLAQKEGYVKRRPQEVLQNRSQRRSQGLRSPSKGKTTLAGSSFLKPTK